jgi:GNAT superfamily N-acetyltransferase
LGWPPHGVGSTENFVAGADPTCALVAVDNSTLLSHVALHERSAGSVMLLAADSLGVGVASLAVVARLFVDPRRRHRGIGRALLDAAAAEANRLHKYPILDVWTELDQAIRLYEVAERRRLGSVVFPFRSPCGPDCLHQGPWLASFVYAAPSSSAPGRW